MQRIYWMILSLCMVMGCDYVPQRGVHDSLLLQADEDFMSFRFDAGEARLSPKMRNKMRSFVEDGSPARRYISVDLPYGGEKLTASRQNEVIDALGLNVDQVAFSFGNMPPSQGAELSYGLLRRSTPYGVAAICEVGPIVRSCANASNLAQMIADPADLPYPRYQNRYHPRPKTAPKAGVDMAPAQGLVP